MLYAAGVPCRRFQGEFCGGYACDFNSGVCTCPTDRLGDDCGTIATRLTAGVSVSGELTVEEAHYFTFSVTPEMLDSQVGTGILVNLLHYDFLFVFFISSSLDSLFISSLSPAKRRGRAYQALRTAGLVVVVGVVTPPPYFQAYPYLLARQGAIPYSYDYSLNDAHDLASNFYESDVHSILLDYQVRLNVFMPVCLRARDIARHRSVMQELRAAGAGEWSMRGLGYASLRSWAS
jgi:hypothetical protein